MRNPAVLNCTPGADAPPDHRREAPRGHRGPLAGALILLVALAAVAAGGWGMLSSLAAEAAPARIGEAVEVPGGLLRVDAVTPEYMAPMQSDKFAASGMSMSAMGMDMAPEGKRRIAVDVSLAAEKSGLPYSPERFRIAGEGMEETGPIRDQLGAGAVPLVSAISGTLIFQVPEDAKELELRFADGRPVALDLPAAEEGDDHSHGGARPQTEDGHRDHDH